MTWLGVAMLMFLDERDGVRLISRFDQAWVAAAKSRVDPEVAERLTEDGCSILGDLARRYTVEVNDDKG